MIANDEFIEYASVYANYYGTTKEELEKQRAKEGIVLLELDWQGAVSIKNIYKDALSIYILPPSIEHLTLRLKKRGTDSLATIKERAKIFKTEISKYALFDYLIVNEDFEKACEDLYCIITASQLDSLKQQEVLKELLVQLS